MPADRCVVSERPSNSFKRFLLVTLPCMNNVISISVHKELQSYLATPMYHQVCCPESVNTKRENPMIYGANFTQCVCTGYCESCILSLLSFYELLMVARATHHLIIATGGR